MSLQNPFKYSFQRIKKTIERISSTQSAFIPGKHILDGVLAINEILDHATKEKREFFIFKAYFQKIYDCVDWTFLKCMLHIFGFGNK